MTNEGNNALRRYLKRTYKLNIVDQGSWNRIIANCKRDLCISIVNSLNISPDPNTNLNVCNCCKSILEYKRNRLYCVICKKVIGLDSVNDYVPLKTYIDSVIK